MASRQVNLLTKGFLLGRLDFKYPNPLSRIRENYIASCIENEELTKIYLAHALMDASLVSNRVGIKKDVTDIPYKAFKSFAELTLPYVYGKDKIKKPMDNKEKEYWKTFLAKKKEEAESKKAGGKK